VGHVAAQVGLFISFDEKICEFKSARFCAIVPTVLLVRGNHGKGRAACLRVAAGPQTGLWEVKEGVLGGLSATRKLRQKSRWVLVNAVTVQVKLDRSSMSGNDQNLYYFRSNCFFVALYVMWKQFSVVRVGNTLDINFETLLAEFRAEVIDLNASAAFDWRTTRYTDREFWNCYPAVSMLNAIGLD
jgi:hypothetical protein